MSQIQALNRQGMSAGCRRGRGLQADEFLDRSRCNGISPREGSIRNRRPGDRHVMLVQIGSVVLKAVTEMISVLGYRVTPVEACEKALLRLDREPCEVVISELDMPQINGYQLAQRIRRHSPHTRILLMTACCHAEVVDYMNDRVVDGWLFKPFGMDALKEILDKVKYPSRRWDERPGRQRSKAIG